MLKSREAESKFWNTLSLRVHLITALVFRTEFPSSQNCVEPECGETAVISPVISQGCSLTPPKPKEKEGWAATAACWGPEQQPPAAQLKSCCQSTCSYQGIGAVMQRRGQAATVWFWQGPSGGWEHTLAGSCRAAFLASWWIFQGPVVITGAGSSALRGLFQGTSCLLPLSAREAIPSKEGSNKAH